MRNFDVVVIGGSSAGYLTAMTAKNHYTDKTVMMIRKETKAMVPCGIPYMFGSLNSIEQNIVPDENLIRAGVEILINEVITCDLKNKLCTTKSGEEISFDKIVFATGSTPKVPDWLVGAGLENVFTVPKDISYLDFLQKSISRLNKIIIIGGGFIGVEIANELVKAGKEVTIVEMLPHVLSLVFDESVAKKIEEALVENGVKIKPGVNVKEISGQQKVTGVVLDNGMILQAEGVILAMGYMPNTDLAEKSGLKVNDLGQIEVDEYMRTDNYDVFAVGDCAQKRDFFTRRITLSMLASTASAEARIVGMNLYGLTTTKNFKGTLSLFSTSIGGHAFGVAGLTISKAKKQNLPVLSSKFESPDKHPGSLPNMHLQSVELVVVKESGLVVGGTLIGGSSTGELVNLLGIAIQNHMTVFDILTLQIGTHPLLTAAPQAYPLIKAAEMAIRRLRKK